ncbi:endonuclease III [soil metagenome]
MDIDDFKKTIWNYYKEHKRILPWREEITPYGVVISELMLQQTQVPRILIKYPEFLEIFPDFQSLAEAPFEKLLRLWQGMGYNRRAIYLQQIAQKIVGEYGGVVSTDPTILETFPGIGPATARSIIIYTYNKPEVFIETNIRRIFIHHFFQDKEGISDREILPLVERTVDRLKPRDWYYALMDYGTALVKTVENPNRKSKHYSKQSKFEGSNRQVRGGILKLLLEHTFLVSEDIVSLSKFEKDRVYPVLEELKAEGFVCEEKGKYSISS